MTRGAGAYWAYLREAHDRFWAPPLRQDGASAWSDRMTLVAVIGAYAIFLLHFLDSTLIDYVRSTSPIFVDLSARFTDVAKSTVYLVVALAVFLLAGVVDWRRAERKWKPVWAKLSGQAGFVFLAIAVSGLFTNLVKLIVGRARPKFLDTLGPAHFDPFSPGNDFASFPSGHAQVAGVLTMVLLLWFPRAAVAILPLGLILASMRIGVAAHYPTDVVAGFLVGTLYTLFLARWLALRGIVFRLPPGRFWPRPRFRKAFRSLWSRPVRAGSPFRG